MRNVCFLQKQFFYTFYILYILNTTSRDTVTFLVTRIILLETVLNVSSYYQSRESTAGVEFHALHFRGTDDGSNRDYGIRIVRACEGEAAERRKEGCTAQRAAVRERNHWSDVENTRASRVPTWKRHRQLGSRGPF